MPATPRTIGIQVLYELGYRVCHAKNVALAANTLKRVKSGAITHDEIDRAVAALEHAPLSKSNFVGFAAPHMDDME